MAAGLAACALLVLFWGMAVSASTHWSQTSDELPHLAAGYAYDRFGDFRLQPENGVLPQRVHGLVPLALHARFSDNRIWWENSLVWQLGWDFLYALDNPTDRIVQGARMLNALFGVALGAFICGVAGRLYGAAGGLFALGLYSFCPNFLFQSAQATSDLAGVLFLTLAAWTYWWHAATRTWRSTLAAGLLAGCALTAKFSGLLLVPACALLALSDARWRAAPGQRAARLGRNAADGIVIAGLAAAVVWAFYGFRFAARAPAAPALVQFSWPWRPELMLAGWKGAVIARALSWHLLPEAYLRGLDYVFASEFERPAFLAGQYSVHGWWQFFPVVFLAKTTLALLLGLAVVLGRTVQRRPWADPAGRHRFLDSWLPLALVAGLVWAAAMTSHLNIGHRHILAVYPALFVACGSLATLRGRWLMVPCLLLALQIGESLHIRPSYLAYFNPLVGGPERAYRLVVDSSLDWGQDLPALQSWLTQHRAPGEKLYLSYFGNAWPPHYGVRPTRFLPAVAVVRPPPETYELEPGLYCISATSLAGVYSRFAGPWRVAWEKDLLHSPIDQEYSQELRFARLCKYLQRRQPDAFAGYSILIFRLTAQDLDAALHGPVSGW